MAAVQTEDFHAGDKSYLESIEQYKDNESLYNKLLQNPFMNSKVGEFSPTFWQAFGSLLGDDSAESNYYGEIMSRRNQWLSDALEAFRQQDYDAAASQAARMRDAGLNPDISPASVSAGSAAENDQPIQPVTFPGESDIKSIASASMQFVSMLVSMAGSFQSLKLGNLQLVHDEIANNATARDFVISQIAGSSFFNSENDIDNITPEDLANNILSASSTVDYYNYSPATRKLIRRMFNTYAKDVRSGRSPMAVEKLKSELRASIAANNKSAAYTAASPLFDEDFNSFLRKVASVFGDTEYKAQLSEYNARIAKAGYDTRYFHSASPEDRAFSENQEYKTRSLSNRQEELTEGMWNEIYEICKKEKSWYGTLGLILIPYLRSALSTISSGGLNLRGLVQTTNKNFTTNNNMY